VASTRIGKGTAGQLLKILVVSAGSEVREGWARYFEARGMTLMRCAGPETTHCALEQSAHCPLLEEADAAYYDTTCVTPDLAADLIKQRHLLPIFISSDKPTAGGGHVPEVIRSI